MKEKFTQLIQSKEGKVAIGLGVLLLVYFLISIPAVLQYFIASDSVKIDGKAYSLNQIKNEKPIIYNRYLTEMANVKKEVFSEFAEWKILDLAAKEQGIEDPEEVLRAGYEASEPTEAELLDIYNQYKSQLGGKTFSETRELIRRQVVSNQERQYTQNKQRELVKKYEVSFHLEEPPAIRHEISTGKNNPSIGPKNAKVTVIEFSDFECPFCKRSQEVNKRLRDKYKDQIQWVFRDFPLDFHENAMYAHMAVNCAIPQDKYWEFFEIIFENSGNLEKNNVDYLATKAGLDKAKYSECMKDEGNLIAEIQADMAEGQKFGVTGTPAFFINGIFVSGAMPFESFDEIIQKELK